MIRILVLLFVLNGVLAATTAWSAPRRYGPVQEYDTVWSVANKIRPGSGEISVDQIALALFEHNPSAFDGGIERLRVGATLVVPDWSVIAAIDPERARARLRAYRLAKPGTAAAMPPAPAAPALAESDPATDRPSDAPPPRSPEPAPGAGGQREPSDEGANGTVAAAPRAPDPAGEWPTRLPGAETPAGGVTAAGAGGDGAGRETEAAPPASMSTLLPGPRVVVLNAGRQKPPATLPWAWLAAAAAGGLLLIALAVRWRRGRTNPEPEPATEADAAATERVAGDPASTEDRGAPAMAPDGGDRQATPRDPAREPPVELSVESPAEPRSANSSAHAPDLAGAGRNTRSGRVAPDEAREPESAPMADAAEDDAEPETTPDTTHRLEFRLDAPEHAQADAQADTQADAQADADTGVDTAALEREISRLADALGGTPAHGQDATPETGDAMIEFDLEIEDSSPAAELDGGADEEPPADGDGPDAGRDKPRA